MDIDKNIAGGVKFWSSDLPEWNFGDALTSIFMDELFYDLECGDVDIRLIGSTIADGLIPTTPPRTRDGLEPWRPNASTKVVFWGCGIREQGCLSESARSESDILSVRGPLSASDLRLGAGIPQGEPGLLLPALYNSPRVNPRFVGRTICIPHFNDDRPDLHFISETGCDLVLRPNLRPEKAAILEFIDAVYSADFVLSAALHGAVTAAAYGKPFAYWNNGHIDLPTKWDDFAASIGISSRFAVNIDEGREIHTREISGSIRIPSLWGMLMQAPLLLREKGVVAVLKQELTLVAEEERADRLEQMLADVRASSPRFEKIRNRLTYFSPARLDHLDRTLRAQVERTDAAVREATARTSEIEGLKTQFRSDEEERERHVVELENRIEVLRDRATQDEMEAAKLRLHLDQVVSDREERIDELERSLGDSAREADDLRLRLDESIAETTSTRQKIDEARERTAQEEAANATLRRDLEEARDTCRANAAQALEASLTLAAQEAERIRVDGLEQALLRPMKRKVRNAGTLGGRVLGHFGLGSRAARRIREQTQLIDTFLDEFGWPLVGVAPDGRQDRILRYLMGFTGHLADFPFLRNTEYLDMYPDVANSGMSPLTHYIRYGRREERNVHPLLDTRYYLDLHPEAGHVASCPALHYLQWGAQKGFDPHPLFAMKDYLQRYTDVERSGRNPLLHWMDNARCIAHPLFDAIYYLQHNPDVARSGRNPLTHYLSFGWKEGRNPHPMFDTNYYLAANPDVAKQGMNPLVHYARWGYREGRRSSPHFDPDFYLASYPDIADGRIDPLVHYIEHGAAEGRMPLRPVTQPVHSGITVSGKPIAVMIDALFPRPDQDSGSLDQISFVKIFQMLGYEVHFISVLEFGASGFGDNRPYVKILRDLGVTCIRSSEYDFIESYLFLNNDRIEIVFASRVDFGGSYISVAKELCPSAKIIFNTVDLHYVREEREALLKNDPEIMERAHATREKELALAMSSDTVVVVSDVEKRLLAELVPAANTVVVPLIREFSTDGITAFEQRRDIAFLGGFSHRPNIDAVENFLDTIWPQVHARRPDIRFRVIGSNMPEEMKSRKTPGVDFIGYVAELEPELAKVRLTVAPLRYGAGAKGKLVSSLGYGVPCVVSSVAAEGMGLEDRREVLISDLSDEFSDRIIELYDDPALWHTLSTNGLGFIRNTYSLEAGRDIVEALIADLRGAQSPRP